MNTELLIIGGGPAGYTCALQCARQGLKPVLVEKDVLGGTGLRWGCLPVKYLMDRIRACQTRPGYWNGGLDRPGPVDPQRAEEMLQGCRSTTEAVSRQMEATLVEAGVEILYGTPRITGPNQIRLGDQQIVFERMVLATGTEPAPPPGVTLDGEHIITHREAVNLWKPPTSLVIIGGEVEGLEFASLFSELGTSVTVLEMMPRLLAGMDEDVTQPFFKRLKANGVRLNTGCRVTAARVGEGGMVVETESGDIFEGEKVMVAMARRAVVPEGLEAAGIVLEAGRIPVNDNCQTGVPQIYCIGDLNGRMEMAHTAIQQGALLADFLTSGTPMTWNYGALPRVMFTLPQNGGAGLQETDLLKKDIHYDKAVIPWRNTWRGTGQGDPEGMIKVLAGKDGTLLGVWMTGAEISEQVGALGLLLERNTTLEELKRQLWVHPSLGEGLLQAALQLTGNPKN